MENMLVNNIVEITAMELSYGSAGGGGMEQEHGEELDHSAEEA
jgi:hypothetical protein